MMMHLVFAARRTLTSCPSAVVRATPFPTFQAGTLSFSTPTCSNGNGPCKSAVRYKSTTVEAAEEQKDQTVGNSTHPELKKVPSWPLIGSNLEMDQTKIFDFWPDL